MARHRRLLAAGWGKRAGGGEHAHAEEKPKLDCTAHLKGARPAKEEPNKPDEHARGYAPAQEGVEQGRVFFCGLGHGG
ncbi:MAG: hypothetical protein L0211_07625 [Planctomycetaceae bacterium]|nr:hypothetical protein [Planctomycetaceae bacterium]